MSDVLENVIAIDGAAGTGKSSTAKRIAHDLGWKFLNTGAYYRVATLYCMLQEVPLEDEISVYLAILQFTSEPDVFSITLNSDEETVTLRGTDISQQIYSAEVTQNVHYISSNLQARALIVALQQKIVADNADTGIVLEGRDTTDVIAPNAKVKVLLTASPAVRAQRRASESGASAEQVEQQILQRDTKDKAVNQFDVDQVGAVAEDVVVLDNSDLTLDETVGEILKYA